LQKINILFAVSFHKIYIKYKIPVFLFILNLNHFEIVRSHTELIVQGYLKVSREKIMDKYHKELTLKNQKTILLRLLTENDINDLVTFFHNLPIRDRMYLRIDVMKRENILKRFGQINYDNMFPLIAIYETHIVAIGTIYRSLFGWMRNLGEIRVVVSPEYQRQGLCTILTKELFFHALTTDMYKIQAELMENQKSAISCFERLGFKREARLRKHVTDIKGNRHDLIIMSLDIQELWLLMEDHIEDLMPR
jgi:RimJ/RimL family protein N-acetyltransferase